MDATNANRHCAVVDIGDGRLDPAAALDFVDDPGFGGYAVFVGKVRAQNHGRDVVGVSYDLFDALALTLFGQAVDEALALVGPRMKAHVSHAKGRLGVGDVAVVVARPPCGGLPVVSDGAAYAAFGELAQDVVEQAAVAVELDFLRASAAAP
jgi:hypothetical protein